MTKLEMAVFIANTLFGKDLVGGTVKDDNWKVKELMRHSKSNLEDFYKMAERARRSTANRELCNA